MTRSNATIQVAKLVSELEKTIAAMQPLRAVYEAQHDLKEHIHMHQEVELRKRRARTPKLWPQEFERINTKARKSAPDELQSYLKTCGALSDLRELVSRLRTRP